MPKLLEGTHDGGWYEVDWSSQPTDYDAIGCDGLYIREVRLFRKCLDLPQEENETTLADKKEAT